MVATWIFGPIESRGDSPGLAAKAKRGTLGGYTPEDAQILGGNSSTIPSDPAAWGLASLACS